MELEIKDYLWEIILDWEKSLEMKTDHGEAFAKGTVYGRMAMLSSITRRPIEEIRAAVLNEAHSVCRLLDVKSN